MENQFKQMKTISQSWAKGPFWFELEWFQVGSFNYDNTKMVFNDSFIAEEGAIRFILSSISYQMAG